MATFAKAPRGIIDTMSEPHGQIPFVKYDADGRIGQDLPCLKCGYNLRTLLDDGECPECGASVHESARLAWLCHHDPAWLRRLEVATIWIEVAVVCGILLPLFVVMVGVGVDAFACFVWILLCGALAGLCGFWEVTASSPGSGIGQLRLRRTARCAMALGFVGLFLLMALVTFAQGGMAVYTLLNLVAPALGVSVLACLGVAAWATPTYATALAAKVPEPRLVVHSRIVAWGFALCFFVCVTTIVALLLLPASLRQGIPTAVPVVALWVGGGGFVIMSIWTIPLLHWYRRRFREAIRMRQR